MPPTVVLVRPTEQGNVGAAARAMANMGLERLVLVEPAVEIGEVARARAVGATHILDGVRRVATLDSALAPFRRAVGTTSNRDRALVGPTITARELPAVLAGDPVGTPTALVFGPERSGLTTDELARLSPLVRIPTRALQPTLNLAQAVLVVAYEWSLAHPGEGPPGVVDETASPTAGSAATRGEITGLLEHLDQVAEAIGFARDDTAHSTLRDLRRFVVRAQPDSREVSILRGLCRRILGALERRGDRSGAGGGADGG
jgi:tRNA (cytidine32/uridine32-2'-O)-methyltransferase